MGIGVGKFKELIKSGSKQYPDELLIKDYQNLILSYNAEAEGLSRIGIVGFVAGIRPHLIDHLLIEPIKLLFVCGIDEPDMVFRYLMAKLKEEGKTLWCDAGAEGRKWLYNNLPEKIPFIASLLLNFKELSCNDIDLTT